MEIREHYALQNELSEYCGVYKLPVVEAVTVTLLSLIDEALEIVESLKDKTKPWKQPEVDYDKMTEESIDVYHFWLQAVNLLQLQDKFPEIDFQATEERDFEVILYNVMDMIVDTAGLCSWVNYQGLDKEAIYYSLSMSSILEELVIIWSRLQLTPEAVDTVYRAKRNQNFQRVKAKVKATL